MTAGFHLAQVNIALPLEPLTSARLNEFVRLLDPVNALADRAKGFVWRLGAEEGNATSVRIFEDEQLIVNLSVWESLDDLRAFAFEGFHREVMRRRKEWFSMIGAPYSAAWWIPAGSIPDVAQAESRLVRLRAEGPGPGAFTLHQAFESPASISPARGSAA
jgi:heme-degrading monooxygenase HmoA